MTQPSAHPKHTALTYNSTAIFQCPASSSGRNDVWRINCMNEGEALTDLLWVFQATATASSGCGYPAGEMHALLGFAVGRDQDAAIVRLRSGLAELGWRDEVVTKSGSIPSDLSTVTDGTLQSAAESAIRNGCGVVAYDDPISVCPRSYY